MSKARKGGVRRRPRVKVAGEEQAVDVVEVVVPAAATAVQLEPVEEALRAARAALRARQIADRRTSHAVELGRQAGLSWDRLGSALGVPGETVRRHYSA